MELDVNHMLHPLRSLSSAILLTALCSQAAFADAEFDQAYKAAQAGNYEQAIILWKPLAEQGNPAAQYALGWMYESGQGTAQNYPQAAYWYEKAAQQGDMAAQYVLATMYSKGLGVVLDQQQAVKWLLKAANQGDAIAQFQLGMHFQKGLGINQDDSESFLWFSKAAEQGHLTAQISLGKLYQTGRGIPQDYKLAIYWFERAATLGDALAQFQLAGMYEYGRGTQQDYQQAKTLYLKSANHHYAPSAYKVAEFYEQGKTGNIDLQKALKWYKKAANKGNSAAQFKLGSIYQNGAGVEQNIHSAIEWYYSAAQQDHAQAAYQLGTIYGEGFNNKSGRQIIKTNYDKAAQYYQKASKLDYNLAYARLAFLYENGLGVPTDLERAISLYQQSTQEWAQLRFKALDRQKHCLQTATTKLFAIAIACANREVLDQQIKAQNITAIQEKSNSRTDTFFTGAVIPGSSELEVTYTEKNLFARAKYTFVGRDKPELIAHVKTHLSERYGEPHSQSGDINQGKASFQWLLDDGIELTVTRDWPDTTTFVTYTLPEHLSLVENEKKQSIDPAQGENKTKLELY